MGRKKIDIALVTDPNTRQVTFSKRRTGLFKKANELTILCGSEVAFVVFSPGNKPYSFGHPSVDAVVAKYLPQEPNPNNDAALALSSGEAVQGGGSTSSNPSAAELDQWNQQLADVMAQIHEEEKKAETLDQTLKEHQETICPDCFDRLFEELKGTVNKRLSEFEIADFMVQLSEERVKGMTETEEGGAKKN